MRRQKMKRKHFNIYEEREVNLLTWAEKEHIRYMHQTDPNQWTPEVLAECYPISPSGIEKLLASTFKPTTLEELRRHDSKVAAKIRDITSGKIPMTEELKHKMTARSNVPFSPGAVPDTQKHLLAPKIQRMGEFQKLVSGNGSKQLVEKQSVKIVKCSNPPVRIPAITSQTNIVDPEHGDSRIFREDNSLQTLNINPRTEMTFSEFESQVTSKGKKFDRNVTSQYMKQLKKDVDAEVGSNQPSVPSHLTEEDYLYYDSIKKYKDSESNHNLEVNIEAGKPYLYNQKVGYEVSLFLCVVKQIFN